MTGAGKATKRKRETAQQRDERIVASYRKWSVVGLRETAIAWNEPARAIVRILNRIAKEQRARRGKS